MASAGGRTHAPLIEVLLKQAYRFGFFQAVRLLERIAALGKYDGLSGQSPVGDDARPRKEAVRFRAAPTAAFSPSEIVSIEPAARAADDESSAPLEMTVNFLGLTGPAGTLPRHYTSLVIERCHPRHKDQSMREFYDLFNHRSISLFYRAWEKYRFPLGYERIHTEAGEGRAAGDDLFSQCLYCLVGLGTRGLRGRLQFHDEAVVYYGGHFARRSRCAVSLRELLSDWLAVPASIGQFQGQWLYLGIEDQSSFPSARHRDGRNLELGTTAIAGSKVWDVQGKFRVRLGPMNYKQFSKFLPSGETFRPLCQMVRLYAGAEFDFDVQLVLKSGEVPACRLSGEPDSGPRLGWNMWVRSGQFDHDVDDAVFVSSEF